MADSDSDTPAHRQDSDIDALEDQLEATLTKVRAQKWLKSERAAVTSTFVPSLGRANWSTPAELARAVLHPTLLASAWDDAKGVIDADDVVDLLKRVPACPYHCALCTH